MAKPQPLVVEIPLDRKAIIESGRDPFSYITEVLEKIYENNNLPKIKKIDGYRHKRTLEFKGKRGDVVIYEIRYEHNAKVGNTGGKIPREIDKEYGFEI